MLLIKFSMTHIIRFRKCTFIETHSRHSPNSQFSAIRHAHIHTIKTSQTVVLVVAQLVEQSLPIQEIRALNPVNLFTINWFKN